MEADEDAELMVRVAAGDRVAFSRLFDRHQASVCRFAFRFVGDRARAEELAQDIFVKLYRAARSYRRTARFRTFLFRVAANHCLNEVRRGEYRAPQGPLEESAEAQQLHAPATDNPEATLTARELERAVGAALSKLSERERAAFTLCRFEGLAYREIGEVLQASESAVKSLIHRATVAVARQIEELQASLPPARSRA